MMGGLGISFHRTRNLVTTVLKEHHVHGRKERRGMFGREVNEMRGDAPTTANVEVALQR